MKILGCLTNIQRGKHFCCIMAMIPLFLVKYLYTILPIMDHSEAGSPTTSCSGSIATNVCRSVCVCVCIQNLSTFNVTLQMNELSTRLISESTHLWFTIVTAEAVGPLPRSSTYWYLPAPKREWRLPMTAATLPWRMIFTNSNQFPQQCLGGSQGTVSQGRGGKACSQWLSHMGC